MSGHTTRLVRVRRPNFDLNLIVVRSVCNDCIWKSDETTDEVAAVRAGRVHGVGGHA